MKAILEFDLPDEQSEHQTALDGWRWKKVATDMEDYLNRRLTVGKTTIQDVRDELFRIANENGVQIWE